MHKYLIEKFGSKSRLYALIAVIILFPALYLNTNHLALWGPFTLPFFGFEKQLPFLPWSIFIYLSAFLMIPLAIFMVGRADLGRTAAGLVCIMLFCNLIFLLFPTTFPRPQLPAETGPVVAAVYKFLITVDTPQNCLPSQHAAACLFVALALLGRRKTLGAIFLLWTAAIFISTLTLKQHYFLDLIAGSAIAIAAWFIFFKTKLKLK